MKTFAYVAVLDGISEALIIASLSDLIYSGNIVADL